MAIFLFGFCLLCNFMNFIVILFLLLFLLVTIYPRYLILCGRAGLVKYPLCYRGVNAKPIQIDRRN
ncbi:hypothetical protein A4U88_3035 [Serratia marcescens]|nr:hypothetical protein A4U88_3035 [Serratia marcescens]